MFSDVQPPALSWNAPTRTEPAGRNRKRIVYAKNGSVASHASDGRLRPDSMSGRSACGAASVAMLGPDLRRPLRRDLLRCRGLLRDARELHLRVERGWR